MTIPRLVLGVVIVACFSASACSHTSRIALISNGDLAGRDLSTLTDGPTLQGEDCFVPEHYLSRAFAKAVQETTYDTLIEVEITTTTGVFAWSNCIEVKGKGIESVPGKGIKNSKVEPATYQNEANRALLPIRYVAVEMPKTLSGLEEGRHVEASRGRFGILYRPPQDIKGFVSELQEDAKSEVLTQVDIMLMTPVCIVIVCVGGDSATGYATRPGRAPGSESLPAIRNQGITSTLPPDHP